MWLFFFFLRLRLPPRATHGRSSASSDVYKRQFQTFMIDQNRQYSADQLTFIRMIQSVFAKNHHIEFRDFYEPPFTNLGASVPMPMFSEDDLKAFVGICGRVERQLVRVEA